MKTVIGVLLDELIRISKKSKTDFALDMNMSPSGLSKILSGGKIPVLQEKIIFCKQAALYFTQEIYEVSCYIKFRKIFPIIYDFRTEHELEAFLETALDYALDKDLKIKNYMHVNYDTKNICIWGKNEILNYFCIINSDYLIKNKEIPLEFYGSYRIFNKFYDDFLRHIKILVPKEYSRKYMFNLIMDISVKEDSPDHPSNFLSNLVDFHKNTNLYLFQSSNDMQQPFLLLKGYFLLILNVHADDLTTLTVINQTVYLENFFSSLMKNKIEKISYTRDEVLTYLDTHSDYVVSQLNKPLKIVYNFIALGYLVNNLDLEESDVSETTKETILKLFHTILTKNTKFIASLSSMDSFYYSGKIFLPLIGSIYLSPEERILYLKRLPSYFSKEGYNKFQIIQNEMPKAAVFFFDDFSVVYTIHPVHNQEKLYFIKSNILSKILQQSIQENISEIKSLTINMWEHYLNDFDGFTKKFGS